MAETAERLASSPAVIGADQVRVGAGPVRIPLPAAEPGSSPRVELIRHGADVVGVLITCTCGEQIRLRFDAD